MYDTVAPAIVFPPALPDDLTNESNVAFPAAYQAFRTAVLAGDERIANILRRLLQPCTSDVQKSNLDAIYRVRVRPLPS